MDSLNPVREERRPFSIDYRLTSPASTRMNCADSRRDETSATVASSRLPIAFIRLSRFDLCCCTDIDACLLNKVPWVWKFFIRGGAGSPVVAEYRVDVQGSVLEITITRGDVVSLNVLTV
jgi:hypothetical protein